MLMVSVVEYEVLSCSHIPYKLDPHFSHAIKAHYIAQSTQSSQII